jgi:hypothetical protein
MARFDTFRDFATHYADLTSAEAFPAAFTADIASAQLSIVEEPTSADMPDEQQARACVEQMTGDLFTLLADTRLAPLAPDRMGHGPFIPQGRALSGGAGG